MAGPELPPVAGGSDAAAAPGSPAGSPPGAPGTGGGPGTGEREGAGELEGTRAAGLVEAPKAGGLGSIIGAILRGLGPAVRRTTRRTTRRVRVPRRGGSSTASGGGRGTLLALRYHAGNGASWETTRVAFGRRGNRIAVISSSDASWWRHIRSGSPVQVRVRNRWVDGRARLLARDEDTYARAVGIFIEDRSRAAAERLGVPMDEQGRLVHGERRPGDAVVVWIEVEGD